MTEQEVIKIAYALYPENWDYDGFREDGTPTAKDLNEERRNEWIEIEMERLEKQNPKP